MATKSKFYADLGLESASNLQVDGNATITGDLTVNGTTVTVNSSPNFSS
jgi:cytoskeletal protein CcmA (bactofilin family)